MSQSNFWNSLLKYSFACISILFVFYIQFYNLGELPIVQWDESRLAVNAIEMHQSGNFLITTFEGKTDLYNTKPPLMIWLQVLSTFIWGMNEFAIRFPSALAGFICILLCGYIVLKKTKNLYFGVFAALLLASTAGFIQLHGSYTGDYDALLCLFVLLTFYHHHKFLLKKNKNAFWYFTLFLSFAILSKSAAAFILFPVLLITSFIQTKNNAIWNTLFGISLATIPFIIFCVIREISEPGYLLAILNNDFLGRFKQPLEGHHSAWYYYIVNLFTFRFNSFIYILPIPLVLAFYSQSKTEKYYVLSFLSYLIFLSIAQTRIHWYDMPLLPVLAIILMSFLHDLFQSLEKPIYQILLILLICGALVLPLKSKYEFAILHKHVELDKTHYELSKLLKTQEDDQQLRYLSAEYSPEFYFYSLTQPNIVKGNFKTLQANDVVAYGNLYKDSLAKSYTYTVLDSTENAWKIHIESRK
jgi:4-amino-4-deoxy-L-arabinose transferase-like glycosyltransferase